MLKTKEDIAKRLGIEEFESCLKFPKYFEIETINACNARCVMCTINEWNASVKNVMSDVLWQKFVKEVGGGGYNYWIEKITLTRDGEPLLDKKIAQRIADLKRVGIKKVVIVSNASLLNVKRAEEILQSGIDEIMFSIDGYSKEVYERVRVGLKREVVYNNVLNFIGLRNRYFPKVCIKVRFIEQEFNRQESQIWLDFWKSKLQPTDVAYIMPLHSWGNQLVKEGREKIKIMSGYACISPFSSFAMHYDGRVGLCGVDYGCKFLLGDFKQESIAQIWNGERVKALQEAHLSGNRNAYALCQGCDLWDRTYTY